MNYKKNINRLLSGRLITNLANSLVVMIISRTIKESGQVRLQIKS